MVLSTDRTLWVEIEKETETSARTFAAFEQIKIGEEQTQTQIIKLEL